MDQYQRVLRLGLSMILWAVVFRFLSAGGPEILTRWLLQPNTASFLTYLETGRTVRFSPSLEAFSPQFVESPPPAMPEPERIVIPSFSDTELIDVYDTCNVKPDKEALLTQPLSWNLQGDEPTVLIVHTHSTESYTRSGEDYVETSSWRTLDENYNMLSIGNRVAELLKEQGITAIQDRELHDYPSYNGSYTHARASIREYLEQYPSIRLVLDLHRDASEGGNGQMRTHTLVNGQSCAQLMLVLGTNHKNYEDNLSIALKLHAQLETMHPGIMRPLQLRSQRFNQDLCPGGLLIEVGAAGNTHKEAMAAAEALAKAISALALGTV